MADQREKTILVVNDDGITAPGIRALVEVVQPFGKVVVVAPDKPQSGMGHAITLSHPIRIKKVKVFDGVEESYQCSGTPVDCVKIAVDRVIGRLPDLCVSGINHGSNSSINVIYSGTMSAAMEAAMEGIPSVGFSHREHHHGANLEASMQVARQVVQNVLAHGVPAQTVLNVNIPDVDISELNGIKICRQAMASWAESFVEREDPSGKKYYWMTGRFDNDDKGKDTDEWALNNNYASIVPVHFDFTAHHAISQLNESWDV